MNHIHGVKRNTNFQYPNNNCAITDQFLTLVPLCFILPPFLFFYQFSCMFFCLLKKKLMFKKSTKEMNEQTDNKTQCAKCNFSVSITNMLQFKVVKCIVFTGYDSVISCYKTDNNKVSFLVSLSK